MPVVGLSLIGIGLIVFAGSLWHRNRLPDEGMDAVSAADTVEDLCDRLDEFDWRVQTTGRTYLLSGALMLIGAVLVLLY